MKILFFGRGVINTLYAWAFQNAGHTVEFYIRENRKAEYGSRIDLEIYDARKNKKDRLIKEDWCFVAHTEINENHNYDFIFMSLNAEQVPNAIEYLAPRIGNATLIFLCNIWQEPQTIINPIPRNQVVYGLPGAGGGYDGNKLVGGLYKTIQLGTFNSTLSKRELSVHNLFTKAGFKINIQKDVKSWLWSHFAVNAVMETEVLKMGSFENVVFSREALNNFAPDLKEIIPVLEARGAKPDVMTKVLSGLPPRFVGFFMYHIVFSPNSMTRTLVAHNQFKAGYSVQEVIKDARKYNIPVPRLDKVESLITK